MYKMHSGYRSPDNSDATIWRYMDFAKFVGIIHSASLWFARLDKMEDRYEGAMPDGLNLALLNAFDELSKGNPNLKAKVDANRDNFQREYILRSRRSLSVSCWHLSEFESGAMWKVYGSDSIAIRSTFSRLRDAFDVESRFDVWIGCVSYLDLEDPSDFRMPNLGPALYKRKMYDFEKEIRAVVHHSDGNSNPGLSISVDLKTMIEGVYAGPGQPEWFTRLVKELLEQYGLPEIPVIRSGMDGFPLYLE